MATTSIDQLYKQYLGRTPDAAGAQYWNEQLASGSSFADVERAIAASAEATKLAATPAVAPKNTPTFTEANRDVKFAKPMKVTAAAVGNILRDQLGIKTEGQYVPESINPDGTIKYRFEGVANQAPLMDVYSIYASLPATVTSWGELADQISYLRANPEKQLTGAPASVSQGYTGSLALATKASPTGELTREQMRALADPYYAMTTDAQGNRERTMKDLRFLQPGMDYYNQIRSIGTSTGTGTTTGTGITVGGTGTGTSTGTGTGTTTPGAFLPPPVTTFDGVFGSAMPYNPTTFQMPERAAPVTWGDVNTPTYNPLDTMYVTPPAYNPYTNTTSTQSPFTYQTPAASQPMPQYSNPFANTYDTRPAPIYPMPNTGSPLQYANPFEPVMFAEGGEVGQPGFTEVGTPGFMTQAMSGQMPTYQYPAYGGMPQDVFDFVAPRVSQGKLIQPPRQAPAQFVAPLYTAPAMPLFGGSPTPTTTGGTGSDDIFAPTPVAPPVDNTAAITQAYSDILGRAPDPEGLAYWTQSGQDIDTIRSNIQLAEDAYIRNAYRDVFGQEITDDWLATQRPTNFDQAGFTQAYQGWKDQQDKDKGIASLPAAQGSTTTMPVAETAPVVAPVVAPVTEPVVAPVVEPPAPKKFFQTTNYESGEGFWYEVPALMADAEADASGGSWYNAGDNGGDVGANPGPDAAADAAASAAADAAASNDGPGDAGSGTGDGNT